METMKRAAITGVRQAMLLDAPMPEPKEDWVLVKVHAVPLCTEYKNWLTGKEYGGHEAAGEGVQVAQPGKVKVGDRVVVMPGAPVGDVHSVLPVNISIARTGTIITNFRDWHMAATPMSSI